MSQNTTRPNVLWISTHDINPDLGCYAGIWPGAEYAHTANLDQLAAEGALYSHAYATTPVCAPSRSAIMTGMFPTTIGTMHMRTNAVPPPEVHIFSEYMRAAGYYCTNNFFTDIQVQTPVTAWDDCSMQAHWRNRPDPNQPFFAVFHGMVTHESQIYADDEKYMKNTTQLAPDERHDPDKAPVPPYYPDTPVFRKAVARYSDNITAMDYWVGDLLRQLEEDGLAANTMVVFWSDHGRGFPRAKRWPYEAGLREPLLIRWPAKIPPGTVRDELVYLMDLAATTLTIAGVPVPEYMQATTLLDSDGHVVDNLQQYIFGARDRMDEQEDTMRTVRDSRFRYIRNYHPDRPYMQHHEYAEHMTTWQELRRLRFEEATMLGRGEAPNLMTPAQRQFLASAKPAEELYDVEADPHEINNLADDPRHAADLERLRAALEKWEQQCGDLGMMPEEELVEQWRPGGKMQDTAPPSVEVANGQITATCLTEGASIGWTTDPPNPDYTPDFWTKMGGGPNTGGRYWHLYSGPFPAPEALIIWFRAQRLGFQESADVAVKNNISGETE